MLTQVEFLLDSVITSSNLIKENAKKYDFESKKKPRLLVRNDFNDINVGKLNNKELKNIIKYLETCGELNRLTQIACHNLITSFYKFRRIYYNIIFELQKENSNINNILFKYLISNNIIIKDKNLIKHCVVEDKANDITNNYLNQLLYHESIQNNNSYHDINKFLTNQDISALCSWCGKYNFNIIFDTETDCYDDNNNLLLKLQNIKNFIIIIKTTANDKFGIYIDDIKPSESGWFKSSRYTFLFSLRKKGRESCKKFDILNSKYTLKLNDKNNFIRIGVGIKGTIVIRHKNSKQTNFVYHSRRAFKFDNEKYPIIKTTAKEKKQKFELQSLKVYSVA